MAGRPRHLVPEQAIHLIQRGINRQAILCADADYHFFYEALERVRVRMVNSPQHYPWSSYRRHADGQSDSLLQMHSVFRKLGSE